MNPTITGKEQIAAYRLSVLRGALKLEILGMKRRGKSAYAIIKQEYGLKGTRQNVLAVVEAWVEDLKHG